MVLRTPQREHRALSTPGPNLTLLSCSDFLQGSPTVANLVQGRRDVTVDRISFPGRRVVERGLGGTWHM